MAAIPGLNEPFPNRDRIVDKEGKPTKELLTWVEQSLLARVNKSPAQVQDAFYGPDLNDSTSGTLGGAEAAGLYYVLAYLQVIAPDGAGSDVTLALAWTRRGVVQIETFPIMNGDTINTHQGVVFPVQIDAGTPISYVLVYNSTTPNKMTYDATLSASLVQSLG